MERRADPAEARGPEPAPARWQRWLAPMVLLVASALFAAALRVPAWSLALADSDVRGDERADASRRGDGLLESGRPPPWLLPVDDAYILIRFAQQAARGRLWQWTDGELSTGATSLVYPFLLVPGLWLGEGFAGLAAWSRWSTLVGVLSMWLLGLAGRQLLRVVRAPEPWPLALGLALVWSGPIPMLSAGGMESALACAGVLLAIALAIEALVFSPVPSRRAWTRALACAAILPWLRPELGVVTVLIVAAALVRQHAPALRAAALAALVPGAILALGSWLVSGDAMPAGVVAKSALSLPFATPAELAGEYWVVLRSALMPGYLVNRWGWIPPPVGIAALVTAALSLAGAAMGNRTSAQRPQSELGRLLRALRPLASLAVVWLCLVALAPLSAYVIWQYGRHHHPGLACAWALAFAGPALALGSGSTLRSHPRWLRACVLLLPALLLLRVPYWSLTYLRSAASLAEGHGPIAAWLARHDEDRVLLVHDAGLLSLAHDGPIVDLMGLGTSALTEPYRHGPGAAVEALARRGERPELVAGGAGLIGIPELFGREILRPRAVQRGPEQALVLAAVPGQLLERTPLEVDGVDFADLDSERRARLRWNPAPKSDRASVALALRGASGQSELHGCRPLRGELTMDLPAGTEAIRLRAAAIDGSAALEVKAGDLSRTIDLDAAAREWTDVTVELGALGGATSLTLARRLEGGAGRPCLESIGLVPGNAARSSPSP